MKNAYPSGVSGCKITKSLSHNQHLALLFFSLSAIFVSAGRLRRAHRVGCEAACHAVGLRGCRLAKRRCYVKKFTYDVIFFTYYVIFFT